jgi:hypothetical protein
MKPEEALRLTALNDSAFRVLVLKNNVVRSSIIAEALIHNTELRGLLLDSNTLSADDMETLLDAIPQNTGIKMLGLSNTKMTAEGMYHLAEFLKTNESVTALDISNNEDLGPAGCRLLAEALKQNRTVRTIDMCRISAGEQGIQFLAKALDSAHCKLQNLSVSHNNIGLSGIQHLCDCLQGSNRSLIKMRSWDSANAEQKQVVAECLARNQRLLEEQEQSAKREVQHEKDVRWRLSMPRSNTAHSISLNSPIESGTNARRRSFGDVSESAFEMVASSEPQKMMKQLPSAAGEAAAEPAAQDSITEDMTVTILNQQSPHRHHIPHPMTPFLLQSLDKLSQIEPSPEASRSASIGEPLPLEVS